jgi:GT2 family glycosyltransferase
MRRIKIFLNQLVGIYSVDLEPINGSIIENLNEHNCYSCNDKKPQFNLIVKSKKIPKKWVRFTYLINSELEMSRLNLLIDVGKGFIEAETKIIPITNSKETSINLFLPENTKGFRLVFISFPGNLCISKFHIKKLSPISVFANLILRFFRGKNSLGELFLPFKKSFQLVRIGGIKALIVKIFFEELNYYKYWVKNYGNISNRDRKRIRTHINKLNNKPKISVIMPVYNTPEKWLCEAIESVISQLYPMWELCIADDASTEPHIKKTLDEYRQKDSRIKVVYRQTNGHISLASNSALDLCSGEYVALLDHDDKLSEHALYMLVNEINIYPDADIFYSDEDKISEVGERFDPYFKPDWNPDLFTSQNYLSHLILYRKSLLQNVNGFRKMFEGAQDWDLAFRIIEIIPESHIRHIPFILYHWRAIQGSTARSQEEKEYVKKAQFNTIKSHLERVNKKAEIKQTKEGYWKIDYLLPNPVPMVSIIIPTKNQVELLSKCINSILEKTIYTKFELIIINNQTDDLKTLRYFDHIKKNENIIIVDYDKPFNYSAICNFGVKFAKGDILVFLNNDIEVITPDWLIELVRHSSRSEIGAVGAKLYFPNETIQHAGVILGLGGVAGHAYLNLDRKNPGQMSRAFITQNYSAVTAACMAIKKTLFEKVNGFNENDLKIAFNDIDFCIRILKNGYKNLWTPYAELYHHESASRGYEDTPEKQARFRSEIDYMKSNWTTILEKDPAYNPNLSLNQNSFSFSFPPRIKKPWEKK